jgi:DNA-binding GntR family transcriptional regulator
MAPETSAARRAYEEIKLSILEGRLPVRSRIDVQALARSLGLSSMPVRQALSLLTWERLVRTSQPPGYQVALWSEAELAELYGWRGALLLLAAPNAASGEELRRIARTQPYGQAAWNVMRAIELGTNGELQRAARSADERLHIARAVEEEVLGDVAGEFATLVDAIAKRSKRLKALINAFHRRRAQNAATIRQQVVLRALSNNGASS